MPSSCCCLSTLSALCTSAFSSWCRFLSLPFAALFSLIATNVSSDIRFFFFCHLTHPFVSLATSSRTALVPFQRSSGVTSSSNAVNLLVTCKLYCFFFLELLGIQRQNAVLSLSVSQPDFQRRHEQLMVCDVAVCSWIRATIHQTCFPSLCSCDVVCLIPGVAIRRGLGIQPPWMLFEHGIGHSQLVLQAEVF